MQKKTINNKSFIKQVLLIAIPIIIQQLLISSYSLINSFLVSKIDYDISLSAVGLAFSYEAFVNCIFFAITTGISIFSLQFIEKNDKYSLNKTFKLMIIVNLFIALINVVIVYFFNKQIIGFFANQNASFEIIKTSQNYIKNVCFMYFFMAINQSFSAMYRNIKKTFIPLIISIISLGINIFLSYSFVNGFYFIPKIGLIGVAYSIVITNFLSSFLFIIISILNKEIFIEKNSHFSCLNKDFYTPILKKIYPLLINEILVGLSFTMYAKIFFYTNESYPSYVMADKIAMIFFNTTYGLNNAASVLIGTNLHTNEKLAKIYHKKFMILALGFGVILSIFMFFFGPSMTKLYNNPTSLAKTLTLYLIIKVFLRSVNATHLATLRVIGNSKFILLIDGFFEWIFGIIPCYIAISLKVNNIIVLFLLSQISQLIRLILCVYKTTFKKWNIIKV